jgi:hypothetical protein
MRFWAPGCWWRYLIVFASLTLLTLGLLNLQDRIFKIEKEDVDTIERIQNYVVNILVTWLLIVFGGVGFMIGSGMLVHCLSASPPKTPSCFAGLPPPPLSLTPRRNSNEPVGNTDGQNRAARKGPETVPMVQGF